MESSVSVSPMHDTSIEFRKHEEDIVLNPFRYL